MQTDTIAKDQELEKLQKQTASVLEKAKAFQLDSESQFGIAVEVLSWIATQKKKFETIRIKLVKPLNDHVTMINNTMFKPFTNILAEARTIMDEKIIAWNRKQEAERLAEEARIRKEAEKLSKKTGVAVQEIIESAPVQAVQKTTGTLTITKRWTYEVEDPLMVPKEYLMVDTTKISHAVRDGMRTIRGVKIYQIEVTSTR